MADILDFPRFFPSFAMTGRNMFDKGLDMTIQVVDFRVPSFQRVAEMGDIRYVAAHCEIGKLISCHPFREVIEIPAEATAIVELFQSFRAFEKTVDRTIHNTPPFQRLKRKIVYFDGDYVK